MENHSTSYKNPWRMTIRKILMIVENLGIMIFYMHIVVAFHYSFPSFYGTRTTGVWDQFCILSPSCRSRARGPIFATCLTFLTNSSIHKTQSVSILFYNKSCIKYTHFNTILYLYHRLGDFLKGLFQGFGSRLPDTSVFFVDWKLYIYNNNICYYM